MRSTNTKRWLSVLLCLALGLACSVIHTGIAFGESQSPATSDSSPGLAIDPFDNRDGIATILYNNPNGLPTSEANAIAQTSEGFIWIGGYSGLIRYDGNNFERIDSTTGVASVVSLFVDSRDRLWVGTNDSGVAVMERGEFRFFSKGEGLGSASVRAIVEDAVGNVYAATTKGIAVVNEDMELRVLDDARLSGAYISSLRMGAGGLLYGLTRDGSVFIIDEGRVIAYYTADDIGVSDINAILPDLENPGYAYFGTAGSEVYHGMLSNLREADVYDISPLGYVKSLEMFDDQLWIMADNGIGAIVDGKVRQFVDAPLNNSIEHAMVDYEGNLWFASSRQGVMKVVANQFFDLYKRYGLPSVVVNTTCRWNDLLLIGTDDGLSVLDDDGQAAQLPLEAVRTASGAAFSADTQDAREDAAFSDLTQMLADARIRSIVRDDEGNLWFSTYGAYGLVRYDGKEAVCFTIEDGMPSDRVRTALQLSDGTMGVACTGGAVIIDGDKVRRVYGQEDGIENLEILTIAETSNGELVLGTDGDGIYIVGEGETRHLGVSDGLASEVVLRVKPSVSRDFLWVVTSNSIAYMNARSIDEDSASSELPVTTVRKFPYPNNFDLYENSAGKVWVLASNGIYVVSADELLANEEIDPVYYGVDNGLTVLATANSYSELTDEGDLYVAGSTGVVRVNIEKPFEDVSEVKMAVPFVRADDELVYPNDDGTFTIPSNAKRLTVYPFVYAYSLMNPEVSYSLMGFETRSHKLRTSDLVPVDYTNLHGGTYSFAMRLYDSMGHGDREVVVRIYKEAKLVERAWFRLLLAGCFILLMLLAAQRWVHYRTQRLLKKQEEDRLYIREMSEAFARIIDMKDAYTSGHSSRVAYYTKMLTRELGYDDDTVERYYNIALLHDIGKIGVPKEVLNKPGRLTDEEFEAIKSHTVLGRDALAGISIMPEIAIGAGSHHERPDGKGYPEGLKKGEIPRVAQIIAVADTFDAMYSDRPYRKRMNFDKAVSIIREVRGTQLTEDVVDAFLRLVERGKFRASNDTGGGTTEDIDNIHKRLSTE